MSFPLSSLVSVRNKNNGSSQSSAFPWESFDLAPLGSVNNQRVLSQQNPHRVQAHRFAKPDIRGTSMLPFTPTFQDDEKATFHCVSAMPAFVDKSSEELRMEDYEKRQDGSLKAKKPIFSEVSATIAPTTLVEDDPMEYESLMDDTEVALLMADKFISIMSEELASEEWKELADFVTPLWTILGNQLTQVFRLRQKWKSQGQLSQFTIGYYYGTHATMIGIREHGLLNKVDRDRKGVFDDVMHRGLGDGVYTANCPKTFYNFVPYATEGVMVLRLTSHVGSPEENPDTIPGIHRHSHLGDSDILVLSTSDQSAVLVEFDGPKVNQNPLVEQQLFRLQSYFEELLDRVFAEDVPSNTVVSAKNVPKPAPVLVKLLDIQKEIYLKNDNREFTFSYVAPQTLWTNTANYSVPLSLSAVDSNKDCTICLDSLSGNDLFRIKGCTHVFHKDCIDMVMQKFSACPVCRYLFKEPRGESPAGNLSVVFDTQLTCSGFPRGTIRLGYGIAAGVQKIYHDNRTVAFREDCRVSYLPDTSDGRKLLKRLLYAFLHGLTFTVGTSLSTGQENSVTWGSIEHKTSVSNSSGYGYPAPEFLDDCNTDLNDLGVPASGSNDLNMPEMEEIDRYIKWRDCFE